MTTFEILSTIIACTGFVTLFIKIGRFAERFDSMDKRLNNIEIDVKDISRRTWGTEVAVQMLCGGWRHKEKEQ